MSSTHNLILTYEYNLQPMSRYHIISHDFISYHLISYHVIITSYITVISPSSSSNINHYKSLFLSLVIILFIDHCHVFSHTNLNQLISYHIIVTSYIINWNDHIMPYHIPHHIIPLSLIDYHTVHYQTNKSCHIRWRSSPTPRAWHRLGALRTPCLWAAQLQGARLTSALWMCWWTLRRSLQQMWLSAWRSWKMPRLVAQVDYWPAFVFSPKGRDSFPSRRNMWTHAKNPSKQSQRWTMSSQRHPLSGLPWNLWRWMIWSTKLLNCCLRWGPCSSWSASRITKAAKQPWRVLRPRLQLCAMTCVTIMSFRKQSHGLRARRRLWRRLRSCASRPVGR